MKGYLRQLKGYIPVTQDQKLFCDVIFTIFRFLSVVGHRFAYWVRKTTENSLDVPATLHCRIARQIRRKTHKTFLESEECMILRTSRFLWVWSSPWCFILAILNRCDLISSCCDLTSQRNRLWTENSVNKTERAKPLRTQKGGGQLNSRDPNSTFNGIESGIAGKPCEPNLLGWQRLQNEVIFGVTNQFSYENSRSFPKLLGRLFLLRKTPARLAISDLQFGAISYTIGAENITYIKKNWWNLFDATRCNTLHHLNCQEFIWCNFFWCCSFGVVMVPMGLTHIHDAGIGDVLLCLCKLRNTKLQGPRLM